MSPVPFEFDHPNLSFPRVSGDEPALKQPPRPLHGFSPRERG